MDNNDIYEDVNDDELIELVQEYPSLLDDSDDIRDRYIQLFQFNTLFDDNATTDEIPV